jgi:hypothetical protein
MFFSENNLLDLEIGRAIMNSYVWGLKDWQTDKSHLKLKDNLKLNFVDYFSWHTQRH